MAKQRRKRNAILVEHRAMRLLSRHYTLAMGFKFLEIRINVDPPSYVKIILGYHRGQGTDTVSQNAKTRRKLTKRYASCMEKMPCESVCRKWFAKFRCGDFDLQDAPRSGRPVTTDVDQIKALIDSNRHLTTTEIGHNLNIDQSTVSRHLRKLGMRMITGDEKWIAYNNVSRKRSWSKRSEAAQTVAKAGLHPKKIMLSI
ncbi:histone-lysine N-methyltransferase SETMAR-like [Pogonomyrmex barbatus]|uniref:Histone-lysine N-methyltransferase SETMAR-like n=1 Tax=Pogonomyrmex barbatus TaxID=144034 RepID=A0A6I9VQB2_9HYME|nr:histone-lysine N-methyltransferase SETMAR-like [Pogonomyrmex barbatus]